MNQFNPWLVFGVWRILYLLLIFLALKLLPSIFGFNFYEGNFKYPPFLQPEFLKYFNTWDGNHYFFLAEQGFSAAKNTLTAAFYPLWPKIWGLANSFLPQFSAYSGIVLANIFSWLGLCYFYKFVELRYSSQVALMASILCLSNITAFFFCFPYTESLFFLLTSAALWNLQKKKIAWAALFLFFLPLCRATGIYCLLPLGHWWLSEVSAQQKGKATIVLLSPVLGYLAYFLFMYLATGDAFEGVKAQRFFIAQGTAARLFDVPAFGRAFFNFHEWHHFLNSYLDRIYFILFLVGLALMVLKKEWLLFYWALPYGLIPALLNHFFSYLRYFQLVFPLYIIFALCFEKFAKKEWFWLVIFFQFALQVIMLIRHINNFWVA